MAAFDRVYAVYPNKSRKQLAQEAWYTLAPSAELAAVILADVQARVKAGWVRLERRFIPLLKNYLSERQWEEPQAGAGGVLDEDAFAGPFAWQCRKCGQVHEGTREQCEQFVCLGS